MRTPLVRGGVDARLLKGGHWCAVGNDARPTLPSAHKLVPVYSEMLVQCCRDYPGLPDPRVLTMTEIRFFYEWLRRGLHKATGAKT